MTGRRATALPAVAIVLALGLLTGCRAGPAEASSGATGTAPQTSVPGATGTEPPDGTAPAGAAPGTSTFPAENELAGIETTLREIEQELDAAAEEG